MRIVLLGLLAGLLAACDTPTESAPEGSADLPAINQDHEVITQQWQQVTDQVVQDAAGHWQAELEALIKVPSANALAKARGAFNDFYRAVNRYYLLLAARACLGGQRHFRRLDRWPLYPGYIDSLPQWPESGIINDPTFDITLAGLRAQQGATDTAEVSLGFQAIAFVLNGSPQAPRTTDDFAGDDPTAQRRRRYLTLANEQLMQDLGKAGHRPLTVADLQCGLKATYDRWASLQQWQNANRPADGLYLAGKSSDIITEYLPMTLQSLPDETIASWEQEQPGIKAVLIQAEKDGWGAVQSWLTAGPGK